jgi:hypothetical protein
MLIVTHNWASCNTVQICVVSPAISRWFLVSKTLFRPSIFVSDKEAMGQLSSVRQCFPVSAISTVLLAYLFRYYWLYRGPTIDSVFKVRHLSVFFSLLISSNILFCFGQVVCFQVFRKKLEKYYVTLSQNMCFIINLLVVYWTKLFFLKQNVHIAPKLLKSENALRLH